MTNVFDGAGRQIVDNENLIATLEISVRKV
jgi:hypothetical protein